MSYHTTVFLQSIVPTCRTMPSYLHRALYSHVTRRTIPSYLYPASYPHVVPYHRTCTQHRTHMSYHTIVPTVIYTDSHLLWTNIIYIYGYSDRYVIGLDLRWRTCWNFKWKIISYSKANFALFLEESEDNLCCACARFSWKYPRPRLAWWLAKAWLMLRFCVWVAVDHSPRSHRNIIVDHSS